MIDAEIIDINGALVHTDSMEIVGIAHQGKSCLGTLATEIA